MSIVDINCLHSFQLLSLYSGVIVKVKVVIRIDRRTFGLIIPRPAKLRFDLFAAMSLVLLCSSRLALAAGDKEALAGSFGVHYRKENGRDAYYLHVQGTDRLLFALDAAETDVAEARRELIKLVASRQKEIETRYNVAFSKEDELTSHGGFGPLSRAAGYVKARAPRLDELYGVEAAIKHSMPSHLLGRRESGEGIKFCFLKEVREAGAAADWGFDKNGKPACFIEPFYTERDELPHDRRHSDS
jgi:hypothetical protein